MAQSSFWDEAELLSQAETADRLGRNPLAATLFQTLLKRGPTAFESRLAVVRQLIFQESFLDARSCIESWFGETANQMSMSCVPSVLSNCRTLISPADWLRPVFMNAPQQWHMPFLLPLCITSHVNVRPMAM